MNELYQPTPSEILGFRPNEIRAWLTKRMAADPILAEKIAGILGYTPRWSRLNCVQYAQVALAWASLSQHAYASQKIAMREMVQELTRIVKED